MRQDTNKRSFLGVNTRSRSVLVSLNELIAFFKDSLLPYLTFHNFIASVSGGWRYLCSLETISDGLGGSKTGKGSVRTKSQPMVVMTGKNLGLTVRIRKWFPMRLNCHQSPDRAFDNVRLPMSHNMQCKHIDRQFSRIQNWASFGRAV